MTCSSIGFGNRLFLIIFLSWASHNIHVDSWSIVSVGNVEKYRYEGITSSI